MPTINEWRGDAQPVAQVDRLTVGGTPASGNTITATINRKTVTYTYVTSDTTALMAAGLYALLNACEFDEFKEVTFTYTDGDSYITCTAETAGNRFTLTASATGGGATLTRTSITSSSGPNDADVAANWSRNAVPVDTDAVVIRSGADIINGIDTAFAHDLDSFTVYSSFTGSIGLPYRKDNAAEGYVEYRPRYAVLGNTTGVKVTVGVGDGSGSSRVNLSIYGNEEVNILNTAARPDANTPAVNIITRSANTAVVNVSGGEAGFCTEAGQTGRIATARVLGGRLVAGSAATVDSVDQDGGTMESYGTATAVAMTAGEYTQWEGTLGTLTQDGGTAILRQEGTITLITSRGQGGLNVAKTDFSQDPRARTLTNGSFTGGAIINDPNFTVTLSNPITMDKASLLASTLGARFSIDRT